MSLLRLKRINDEWAHLAHKGQRYYYRHKDEINQRRYQHKFHNIPFWLYKAAKARAAKKSIEFDIGPEDIVVPEFCPVFGVRLQASENVANDFSPSLDRINNLKGYVKGNIQVISNKANRMKSDASLDEIRILYEWLLKQEST